MTLHRPDLVRSRNPRLLAVLACCLAPLLAACSGAAAQVQLPAKVVRAVPAASASAAALPTQQQVVAALTGYTSALGEAAKSRSPALARRLLTPYLAGDRLGGVVQAVSGIWAKGESFYGQDILHILTVRIDGRRAFVHDCDDTSSMGLQNAGGQPVPGTAGIPQDNLVTRLDLVGGHWMVESQLVEDVPCAP
jgi:hypothetical protein